MDWILVDRAPFTMIGEISERYATVTSYAALSSGNELNGLQQHKGAYEPQKVERNTS